MINVYWSCDPFAQPSGLRVDDLVDLKVDFFKRVKKEHQDGYARCPSMQDFFTNLYGLKSLYDYGIEFDLDEKKINSKDYDPEFLNRLVVRNLDSGLFSWPQDHIYFTDADSLMMELSPAFMEHNSFTNYTFLLPGRFDIGKWFRPIDCAFHLRHRKCKLDFRMSEIIMYLRFRTTEKINFVYFNFTKELHDLTNQLLNIKEFKYSSNKNSILSFYYNVFKKRGFKKRILKLIKANT